MSKELVLHTLRDISRGNMGRLLEAGVDPVETATHADLKLGAILRIADAMVLMAMRHSDLLKENNALKIEREELLQEKKKLERERNAAQRSAASLRGVLTRRDKEMEKLKETNGINA